MGRASGALCGEWLAELVGSTSSDCIHLLQEVDFVCVEHVPASHVFHKHSDCSARAGILIPSKLAGQIHVSSKHVDVLCSNRFACSVVLGGENCKWGVCSSYLRDSFRTDEEFLVSVQQLRAHLAWMRDERAKFLIVGCDA